MVLYWKIWNRWPAGNWNQKQPFNPRFLEFQYSELDNHTNSLFYVLEPIFLTDKENLFHSVGYTIYNLVYDNWFIKNNYFLNQ